MAEFIDFEAVTEQDETVLVETDDEENEENEVSDVDSFIDDSEKIGESDARFYRQLDNIDRPVNETLKEEYEQSLAEIENFDEFSNFCKSSENELCEVGEFKDSAQRLEKFDETFLKSEEHNSFPELILYAVRFSVTQKTDVYTGDDFKEDN